MFDAQLFRRARLGGGLTYREVGAAAQLDSSAICHYEGGRAHPSTAAAQRWHDALVTLLTGRGAEIAAVISELQPMTRSRRYPRRQGAPQ